MKADDLKRKKEEAGMTTATLSKLSGVPVGTINKILNGETKSPRCDTLSALEQALDSVWKHSKEVRESVDPYGVGESICPEKPTTGHQVLVSQLILQFGRFIEETGKNDLVLPSHFCVYSDGDKETVDLPSGTPWQSRTDGRSGSGHGNHFFRYQKTGSWQEDVHISGSGCA